MFLIVLVWYHLVEKIQMCLWSNVRIWHLYIKLTMRLSGLKIIFIASFAGQRQLKKRSFWCLFCKHDWSNCHHMIAWQRAQNRQLESLKAQPTLYLPTVHLLHTPVQWNLAFVNITDLPEDNNEKKCIQFVCTNFENSYSNHNCQISNKWTGPLWRSLFVSKCYFLAGGNGDFTLQLWSSGFACRDEILEETNLHQWLLKILTIQL